jgi:hypothetical protein
MNPKYFYLHDDPSKRNGMHNATLDQCKKLNEQGNGIFWTLNELKGTTRRSEDVTKINTWVIEIDDLTKEEQRERIKSGLIPSLVVESKRGYHVYFFSKEATKENYANIVGDRLAPFYGADSLKDYARVYRVPGFFHQKDPNDPFMIEKVWEYDVSYTEDQMRFWYKDAHAEDRTEMEKILTSEVGESTGDFWRDVYNMDQMEALSVLSGSDFVCGEVYDFKRGSSGKYSLLVNGKSVNCWIDKNRKIGSHSKGGPSVAQWLKWYGKEYKQVYRELKKAFPQLGCKNESAT